MGCSSISIDQNNSIWSDSVDLDFENSIENTELSVFSFHYLYNGGGVGIADFNLDGNKDIFLGGNLVSSRLLIGDGELNFSNVTNEAGLLTNDWINGISIVDINHDGKPDIYLSVGGADCKKLESCRNLLFINNSTPDHLSFEEVASTIGLDISGYSQQGLFIDVDLDGDLDLYQLQNYVDPNTKNYPKPKRYFSKKSFDKLLINQEVETGRIEFVDKSIEWGVQAPGFGLGVAMTDVNNDGYPDIYIANDFISDDIFYINQSGKSFVDKSADLLKHTSYNSMGVDIADINNDQLDDILVVDMLPSQNSRQKTMLGAMNYDKYKLSLKEGYNPQFIQNTLQLAASVDSKLSRTYNSISRAVNVHETDWSWSPLIADFDNDTDADIYITNGYGKDITDLDFVNYSANPVGFGTKELAVQKIKEQIDKLPDVKLSNVFFEQKEYLQFSRNSQFNKSITNGAVFSDLDNDGDLDIVQNNLNQNANILINKTQGNNFLKVVLKQNGSNTSSLGSRVSVQLSNEKWLSKMHAPVRSYLSTMDYDLIFGLGEHEVLSIKVDWVGGGESELTDVAINQTLIIDKSEAVVNSITEKVRDANSLLDIKQVYESQSLISPYEYAMQPLLLKHIQKEKLFIDVIEDSKTRVFIKGEDGNISLSNSSTFEDARSIYNYKGLLSDLEVGVINDLPSIVFATVHDGKSELFILQKSQNIWDAISTKILPKGIYQIAIGNCDDVDGNEVLVGKQPHAEHYPKNPNTDIWYYSLNKDVLIEHTDAAFDSVDGIVTDLKFADLDGDDKPEVFVTGEWMTPCIFKRDLGKWNLAPNFIDEPLSGLWQSCSFIDADLDGDLDVLLANWGLNSRLKASKNNPLQLIVSDLDGNGKIDPLIGCTNSTDGKVYSYHTRDDIAKQLPSIKQHYPDYQTFGSASFSELLSNYSKSKIEVKLINELESVILENVGNLKFEKHMLPFETQLSNANSFYVVDINKDGKDDVIGLMNDNTSETHNGNMDGSNGVVLLNNDNFKFLPLKERESGLHISNPSYRSVKVSPNEFLISTKDEIIKVRIKGDALLN